MIVLEVDLLDQIKFVGRVHICISRDDGRKMVVQT